MLEANTDRSYFMIGAVIVAALLIGGAIFIFSNPDSGVIGEITKTIGSLFKAGNDAVAEITPVIPGNN